MEILAVLGYHGSVRHHRALSVTRPVLRYADRVVPDIRLELGSIREFVAANFPDSGPKPWLDREDGLTLIDEKAKSGAISAIEAALCRKWYHDGYVVLPRFFSEERLDRTWKAYEAAIDSGEVKLPVSDAPPSDNHPGRSLNPHFSVAEIDYMLHDSAMSDVISLLLGVKALPFQTIAGHKGSEQLEHSDSIHMTTYPLGYLAANWIAFEDITPDSGPLVYYPGSHRWPYLFTDDVGIKIRGYQEYATKYEPAIQQEIARFNAEPHYFMARKGDVLIWHANLVHGGSPRKSSHASRRALVCHYFATGALCYHDLTGTHSHLTFGETQFLYRHPQLPAIFDPEAYLIANPDVAAAKIDPRKHYLTIGRKEGRRLFPARHSEVPDRFDPKAYLLANPDVAAAGVDPREHYLTFGLREGRRLFPLQQAELPDRFDPEAYLLANPDVAAAGVDPREHYLTFGRKEGRPLFPVQ